MTVKEFLNKYNAKIEDYDWFVYKHLTKYYCEHIRVVPEDNDIIVGNGLQEDYDRPSRFLIIKRNLIDGENKEN